MRNRIMNIASSGTAGLAITTSIQNIESICSIVFVVLSAVILLINFGLRIYDRVKDGKLTPEEIKESAEDAKKLVDDLKNLGGDK